MSLLLFDIKDHIATLIFNQPEKRPTSWVALDPDKLPVLANATLIRSATVNTKNRISATTTNLEWTPDG